MMVRKPYVEEKGLKTVNDEGCASNHGRTGLKRQPAVGGRLSGGKEKAIGFLVGQTMKAMHGKADPGMVNKMLKELLSQ